MFGMCNNPEIKNRTNPAGAENNSGQTWLLLTMWLLKSFMLQNNLYSMAFFLQYT